MVVMLLITAVLNLLAMFKYRADKASVQHQIWILRQRILELEIKDDKRSSS